MYRVGNKMNTIAALTSPKTNEPQLIERSKTLLRGQSTEGNNLNYKYNRNENCLVKLKQEKANNKAFGDFVKKQLDKENNFFEEIKQAQEPQRRKDRRQKDMIQRRFTINNRNS